MNAQPANLVYLDHAATTAVRPEVIAAVADEMAQVGNPSSLHTAGRRARRVIEESRETIAGCIGARPSEVLFTSGGTESDNLALLGIHAERQVDRPRPILLTSAVEHHAVLDVGIALAEGRTWLGDARHLMAPVNACGELDLDAFAALLDQHGDDISLATVMYANNEIGTIQPVKEAAALTADRGVPLHTDAVQALGHLPLDFAALGVDTMAISGHKIGGPMGVGALVAKRGLAIRPQVHGGGQERGVRSGTLDVPSIRGFAVAVELAHAEREAEHARLLNLREELIAAVLAAVPDALQSGRIGCREVLPTVAHFVFPGCMGDSLLYLLDAQGISCSTGSACQAGVPQPSHVLLAMGLDETTARGALRFSLGRTSTSDDVRALAATLPEVVARARAAF
ncbi:cysteine desulfurase [Micrococcales bacterium 31B]|nr:cysteine desulfurase [Micrococcales bacterium 31B]